MKKTGLFKIIMFVLLGIVIGSWIFSSSYVQEGSLAELGMNNVGLFDYFELFSKSFTFSYFIDAILLLLTVGAFYGVLEKTGKYRAWVERIVKNFKGREFLFLVLVSFAIAIITSIFDYELGLFIFFPFIISILLAMGYDKITVAVSTFGAMIIGTIGSTIGYNTTGIISNLLNLKAIDGFYYKLALLLISYVALLLFLSKAKRNKVTEKDLEIEDRYVGENTANKYSIAPIIIVFCLLFVILVLGCTNWSDTFGVNVFKSFHEKVMAFTIKLPYIHITTDGFDSGLEKIAIFSKLLGNATELGSWYYSQMTIMVLIATAIVALCYRVKLFDAMKDGVKKMMKPAFMLLLAYTIIYFAGNQMFYPTIAKHLLGLTSKFSVIISSICMALSSFMHVDILYVANYTIPQMSEKASDPVLLSLLTQSIYGVTSFIAPTSAMLVLGLEYLEIPYKAWVKKIWKLFLALLAITIVVLLIAKYI